MTSELRTDRVRLVALSGPVAGEVLPLDEPRITMGRDPANRICLADRSLSRNHCTLTHESAGWVIRDTGSANGTFVNGIQIREHQVREGDQIRAGDSVFVLIVAPPLPDSPMLELAPAAPMSTTSRLRVEDSKYLQPGDRSSSGVASTAEQHVRALLNLSTALASVSTEEDLFRKVVDCIFDIVPSDAGAVVLVDKTGEFRTAWSRQGVNPSAVPVSRTVISEVTRDRIAVLSRDVSAREAFRAAASLTDAHVRSLICVPMAVRGRVLGAIYLTSSGSAAVFDDSHLQFVTALGAITSIAVENVRHLASVELEAQRLRAHIALTHDMVGESPSMQHVYKTVERLARTDTTVMIAGETGTGKELVARALHLNGSRSRGPFVAFNCAAITDSLLESELFGHERGAFSGAVALKKGKLEIADGGTVFLDEVAELALPLQSKLLRAIQEREFERVGGTRSIKVNIRVIAATNKDLTTEVAAGRFRADLLFRLNVVGIPMPPLRDRGSDIERLALHFLRLYAKKADRVVTGISPAAMQRLMTYSWPGNVRELQNAIERAVVLGSSPQILPEDLPESLLEAPPVPGRELPRFHEAVLETKKRVIIEGFRQAGRSYVETARLLGLDPNYLHRVIRNLEIKDQLEGGA
jgi:transcriptional regulator with GAF, ATPase, and Fis domain